MGKEKNSRRKYHLSCVNSKINSGDNEKGAGLWNNSNSETWNIEIDNDLFKNVSIDINSLSKLNSVEDDRKSVKSIAKTIKRSIREAESDIKLTKTAKRKLKRQFFIQKIDAIHKVVETNKNEKKKKSAIVNNLSLDVLKDLPEENMLFYKSQIKVGKDIPPVSTKSKPILKAKARKEALINDIDTLKKLSANIHLSMAASIGDTLLKKIMNEEL